MWPIITMVFSTNNIEYSRLHSDYYIKCNYAWYFKCCTAEMSEKCQWIMCAENKHITENLWKNRKSVTCQKFRQLIFWKLAEMLQCSAEAEQAPVDNHLLCGGKQGEMEQMALVLFCRGCFLWIRNALLNAKLCGRREANWSPPALHSSSGEGLLLCACSNSRVTGQFCSFINVPSSGMDKPHGNFITSFTHPHFSFSLSPSPPFSLTNSLSYARADEKWFCCSSK